MLFQDKSMMFYFYLNIMSIPKGLNPSVLALGPYLKLGWTMNFCGAFYMARLAVSQAHNNVHGMWARGLSYFQNFIHLLLLLFSIYLATTAPMNSSISSSYLALLSLFWRRPMYRGSSNIACVIIKMGWNEKCCI